jgi:hypothetical protein
MASARLKSQLSASYDVSETSLFLSKSQYLTFVELDESRGDGSCPQSRALDQIKTMTIGLFRT